MATFSTLKKEKKKIKHNKMQKKKRNVKVYINEMENRKTTGKN